VATELAWLFAVTAINIAQCAPIGRGNMPASCRGEVAGMYGTRPYYVKIGKFVKEKDGSNSIGGTVDKGNEGSRNTNAASTIAAISLM